jgi:hypothetical protein
MANASSKMIIVCILASLIVVVSVLPRLGYAQQQSNFAATLSGKNMQPPVSTPATGTAKLSLNPNGTLSYEVDANNIDKVIGVPIDLKNGTLLAELLNVYATTGTGNRQQATIPTGPIAGKLIAGVLTNSSLNGPLFGKSISDLANTIKSAGGAFITIRTQAHQQGEIRGQITAGAAPAAAPAANKTAGAAPAAAPAANKTAGAAPAAAPAANKTAGAAPAAAPAANKTAGAAPAAAPAANKTAGAAPTSSRDCVSNTLNSWSSNFTTAHQQLVDKIASCFGK